MDIDLFHQFKCSVRVQTLGVSSVFKKIPKYPLLCRSLVAKRGHAVPEFLRGSNFLEDGSRAAGCADVAAAPSAAAHLRGAGLQCCCSLLKCSNSLKGCPASRVFFEGSTFDAIFRKKIAAISRSLLPRISSPRLPCRAAHVSPARVRSVMEDQRTATACPVGGRPELEPPASRAPRAAFTVRKK